MSQIAAVSSSSDTLIWVDRVCDYIPGVSSITNFANMIFQAFFFDCCSSSIREDRFFTYLEDKDPIRSAILVLLPILGQVIIAIYDVVQYFTQDSETSNGKAQERLTQGDTIQLELQLNSLRQQQGPAVVLSKDEKQFVEAAEQNVADLPKNIRERILYNERMRLSIEKFRALISNPEEPLQFYGLLSIQQSQLIGSQQEKVDYFWNYLKCDLVLEKVAAFCEQASQNQNEALENERQIFSQLKIALMDLRRTFYREYIRTLDRVALLQEARNVYVQSFEQKERKNAQASVEGLFLDEMMVNKLKESCVGKSDFETVEIEEILLRI